jgi:uncharacterized protein (TIGR02145 family)
MQEVKIGNQIWMKFNLDIDKFSNGDSIPEAKSEEEWIKYFDENKPTWAYYNFDSSYGKKYGKIYNKFAVTDERQLPPIGWHIPNDKEWKELANHYGGMKNAGYDLKSPNLWSPTANGSKDSAFNALPGGQLIISKLVTDVGPFCHEGTKCSFWSTTDYDKEFSWVKNYLIQWSLNNENELFRFFETRGGMYVRCLKNQ